MAYVFLPNGRRLRVRVFPRPKGKASARKSPMPDLFAAPDEDAVVAAAAEAMAAKVMGFVLLNRSNARILDRFGDLGIRDWWLTSGAVVQAVWNVRCGRPAEEGIRDYDVVYFSDDKSEEAEQQVIRDAVRLLPGLSAPLEVANQARVHEWYPDAYGTTISPLTSASEGIMRFPSTTTAVGVKRTGEDFLDVFAPFGLSNVWDMVVKPNRALPLAQVYGEKAARWQQQWPQLIVRPWVPEEEE
jgi:hypothetical protein